MTTIFANLSLLLYAIPLLLVVLVIASFALHWRWPWWVQIALCLPLAGELGFIALLAMAFKEG